MTPTVQERRAITTPTAPVRFRLPVEQGSHEAPTPYTRASGNAGLDPRVARHLLIAKGEHLHALDGPAL